MRPPSFERLRLWIAGAWFSAMPLAILGAPERWQLVASATGAILTAVLTGTGRDAALKSSDASAA